MLTAGSAGSGRGVLAVRPYSPWLERLSLKENGGVELTRVELGPRPEWASLGDDAASLRSCTRLQPRDLGVGAAGDLWLTAECAPTEGPGATLLLHTQPQGSLLELN